MPGKLDIDEVLRLAKEFRKNDKIEDAIVALNGALQTAADHRLYFSRGNCHDLLDMPALALDDYSSAIRLAGDIPKYYLYRGEIYSHYLGNCDAAVADFNKCIVLDGSIVNAYHEMCYCLIQGGQYTAALDYANRAIALDESNATSHFCAGEALLGQKLYAQAAESLKKSVRFDPSASHYWAALGRAYSNLNEETALSDALAAYTRAISIDTQNALLLHSRAQIEQRLGQNSRCVSDLNLALSLSPDAITRSMILDLMSSTHPEDGI